MQTFGTITVVNPGSVGLARDRQGEACYAVLQDGQIQLKRTPYDLDRTVRAMRAAPLPDQEIEGMAVALTGIR